MVWLRMRGDLAAATRSYPLLAGASRATSTGTGSLGATTDQTSRIRTALPPKTPKFGAMESYEP